MPTHTSRSPEWIATAPIRVEQTVLIAASPQHVWSFIADHEGWPRWFTALTSVEVTAGAAGVGGGRRVKVSGRTLDEEFTAWDEGAHFAFTIVRSDIPVIASMAESVRVSAEGDGTRVVYRQGYEGRRGAGWLLRMASRRSASELRKALAELRRQAESTP
jgi:uncharacterized protein YndB with AHSA1/START domain